VEIKLNPSLDWAALAEQYKHKKRLQIPNFLCETSAERLLQCLEKEIDWHLAYFDEVPGLISYTSLQQQSPQQITQLHNRLTKVAREAPFHYLYDCYPLLKAYKENWDPNLYINKWLELINGELVLTIIRKLTGHDDVSRGDSQATRYGPNQYLSRHTDDVPSEARRAAYVLNLTKYWDPNWGGYLQFFENNKNLSDGFVPEFNTLNIFSVPQDHSVATISRFAQRYRYTMVGWFRAPE